MAETASTLAMHFFGKPLAECSIDEVAAAVRKYPYAGPLQVLLLLKLAPDTPEYTTQYNRSLLHFPTPAHLHFALHHQQDNLEIDAGTTGAESVSVEASAMTTDAEAALPVIETAAPATHEPAGAPAADGIITPQTEGAEAAVAEPQKEEPLPALAFEPYHTVDYFASQGIKLSKEEAGTDKFGKQLKSFTEWLKTMKRLPQNEKDASGAVQTDKGVDRLAQTSVADAQVLTESMAAVWEKQGAADKAADVYRKLSLLHPSKSAYFAAKIEALKDKK